MVDRDDANSVARKEAVQPSLWDRLVDEIPSISAEHEALVRDLTKALGDAEQVTALVGDGTRAIERRDDLDEDTKLLAQTRFAKGL